MSNHELSERVERERTIYNEGLKRDEYESILSHASYFYNKAWHEIITRTMQEYAANNVGLELGATLWSSWVEKTGVCPAKLTCINISQKELRKGIELSKTTHFVPEFRLMDAHHLDFDDNSLGFVFGAGILHHLEFTKALDEISRVLNPGGIMFFIEPLDFNPISKIVRRLTPEARTADETPLGFKELKELEKRFITKNLYGQLVSVPLGVLSRSIYKTPDNILMKMAFVIDSNVDKIFPPLRYFYRLILIIGRPKKYTSHGHKLSF